MNFLRKLQAFWQRLSIAMPYILHGDWSKEHLAKNEDELRRIVSVSENVGKIDHLESSMIDNVFDFADRLAREVMVPRQDMKCLFTDDTLAKNLAVVRGTHHTRYPLCVEDKDQVIGTIHVRDLLKIKPGQKEFDLRRVMRPITVISEAMPIARALRLMQKRHVQMVLVADEYGGTAGLITMEDLLEEIVGEIQDEHEAQEPADVVKHDDGSYEFDGMVLLDDITDILGLKFEEAEEVTIGGYIFGLLGRKPEPGDVVKLPGYNFQVLATEGFRIVRLLAVQQLEEKPVAKDA